MKNKPPFCWCHDDTIPAEVFDASYEIFEANDDILEYPEPQDDDTLGQPDDSITWDELLYALTDGAMGTPPQPPKQKH